MIMSDDAFTRDKGKAMKEAAARLVIWASGPEARAASPATLLGGLAVELDALGLQVSRLTTGIPVLHPNVAALSLVWRPGQPVQERLFRTTPEAMRALAESPIKSIYEGGGTVTVRPDRPADAARWPVIGELAAEGMRGYAALPMPFSDGSTKVLTAATERPGGFAAEDVEILEQAARLLAPLFEIDTWRRTAVTLLDTYVGPIAGRRVLEGVIHRGMVETIGAVIWFSDLRGFTAMAERHSGEELVAVLNRHFGAVTAAVGGQGGEVLKFIGDAVLAIFAYAPGGEGEASRRALAAARAALATSDAAAPFGIALHLGDVLYGNVGGESRLDFTVVGPAVNLASRLGGLAGTLGRTLLASAEFAAAAGDDLVPIGRYPLKGFEGELAVYTPEWA